MNTNTRALLFTLSLILNVTTAFSQDTTYYRFEVANEPYETLLGTPVDTLDTAITNNILFGSLADYSIFGEAQSHSYEASATGGFLVSASNDFAYTMDPFLCQLVKKDSGSAFIVHGAGSATDTALVIEWVNMGLSGHPEGDFVNFQLWIYNSRDVVEMRYGASLVTSTQAFQTGYTGPAINFARRHTSFTPAYDDTWLQGDANDPERVTTSAYTAIDGVPDSGVVYRFYAEQDAVPSDTANGLGDVEPDASSWEVYPNPASEVVQVSGENHATNYRWYNLRGTEVLTSGHLSNSQTIHTPKASGLYILELRGNTAVQREVITVVKNE